jgi:hypothetical protein
LLNQDQLKEEAIMTDSSRFPLIGAVAVFGMLALGALGCETRETVTRTPDGNVRVQTEADDTDAEANADIRDDDDVDANIDLKDDDVDADIGIKDDDVDAKVRID